jgi:peptidyl-dipeptidase Dcp
MRRLIIVAASVLALAAVTPDSYRTARAAQAPAVTANPLVAPWTGPYGGVPPWEQARPENFPAALAAGIDAQRREVAAIAGSTSAPTFDNTILAMERAGETYDRVIRMFSVIRDNISTPEFQKIEREWTPKLAAAADEIAFNPALFRRVEAVYASLPRSRLTAEQKRLVTRTHDEFVRAGAKLDAAQKTRLSEINQELATLFSDFGSKVLADERVEHHGGGRDVVGRAEVRHHVHGDHRQGARLSSRGARLRGDRRAEHPDPPVRESARG